MTNRNQYEDDPPPARRVTVEEARDMTGARWVDAHDDRAEIVPSHWTEGGELQRVAGEIVRSVAEPPAEDATAEAWRPLPSVKEVGTPQGRAVATLIRAAPLVVLLFPATLALIWFLDVSGWWILPLWAGLGISAYLAVVWLDLVHNSPASTERHRVNQAARVKLAELKMNHELRREIVRSFIRHLERKE
jgi:hypothetical protein